ncbi:dihydroorotase [Costertonia aggregata]|uniref:Dihydroorotase n=1 Tax=Costertonia aggregata TaxID=343403 RepID=A0A7H9AUF9_9FLAO|nr:dihydroorotase [Costertonia aggregata]QLG47109.1 dihydroorotase [Costertonia aggregata]
MNVLIKSAKIIDERYRDIHLKKRDILVKNGVIESIGIKLEAPSKTKIIDLKDLCVSVGWFDSSVSFGEPGFEERETIANGLYTAAKSGFTDIVLNPNTHPVPDCSSDISFLKNKAYGHAVGLHPLGAVTVKSEGKDLAELFDMKNTGAVGFYDYKRPIENANLLKIALQYAQGFNGLVHSFPLDLKIAGKGIVNESTVSTKLGLKGIPALAEELQIARDLYILEYTGGKLHIPCISTANSVKLVSDAKKKGLDVSCSVAVHNLHLFDDTLEEFDTNYKLLPPLRGKNDSKALIKGLKDGTIDFVTSDHTPIDVEGKRVEFDNADYGSIGLESVFGILNTLFDIEAVIGLLTKGRERYTLETPQLEKGEKANLTLFESTSEYKFTPKHIDSTSKNSAALYCAMKGSVYGIISNGQIII